MIFEEHRVAVTPWPSGYRLGSTMEFTGYDASLDRRRLDYLRRGAAEYLHEPTAEPVLEEWCGWRPMTPDGTPMFIVVIEPELFLIAAAGATLVGILAAMAPAVRASRLDPVVAIRG